MTDLTEHYGSEGLTERIIEALARAGIELAPDRSGALAGVDEFHLGGHRATVEVAAALAVDGAVDGEAHVVDLGCGIGGAARHLAASTGCRVTGIDLTPEFVATATDLTRLLGMAGQVEFRVGSALDVPADDQTYDAATLLHVGMNIADKAALATEIARVLRPGGTLVVYDIMRVGPGEITYPVPWSSSPEWSFVEAPDVYVTALEAAGFAVRTPRPLTDLVLETLSAARDVGPAPATLVTLMGPEFPAMIGNLIPLLHQGTLAPTLVEAALVAS